MMTGSEPVKTEENSPKTDDDFLRVARERAARAYSYWKDNFSIGKKDLAFLYGEGQWDPKAEKERQDEGRPCLTLNQLPQYKRQIVNDMRQATPRISVIPANADMRTGGQEKLKNIAGSKDYSLAEVYENLIRNIENNSQADRHYDRAGQHAVESGFGWLRVISEYQNEDTFDQELKIRSMQNRFSVLCDPDYSEPDTTDKDWCFVGEKIHKTEFEARYPNARTGDLSDDGTSWWVEGDYIRIAEYFYRVPATRVLVLLSDGAVMDKKTLEPVLDELAEKQITIVSERKVKCWKVMWRKITAYSILEEETEWPGSIIPVVPCLGEEFAIGDKTIYLGATHFAEDSQRMTNYWWTAATEKVALSPKAPWVGSAESIEGYETEWQNANRGNPSVLVYNAFDADGNALNAPQRSDFANIPAAEMQLALSATDLTKSTLGMYDAAVGQRSNETSGKAIDARNRESNTGNYHFTDNRDMAIAAIGRVLVEVIPRIYDGERIVRILGEDGSGDWVEINKTIKDRQTGQTVLIHDMAQGKFDVMVKSGPAFATQRQEAVESMLAFVQAVPESGRFLLDLIAQNMDWHLSKEASRRLKMTLPREMLTPEEVEELGIDKNPQPPSPEQQAQMAISQSEADKAKTDLEIKNAEIERDKVRLAIENSKTEQAQIALRQIQEQARAGRPDYEVVAQLVAQAMAEIKLTEIKATQPR